MKLIKTINYKLTEETLEKDIDKFIELAKKGHYHMDKMYQNEGLKIIKQYFKILNEKFKNNELEECKRCYHKLILFLLIASSGEDDLFDYNDLLAKISNDFDHHIQNYFICLVKTCDIDELTDKISEYAASLDIYGFDSDKEILLESLSKEQLDKLEEKMLAKTLGMTKKDEDKQGVVYFLMNIAEVREDKEKYLKLCERFKGVLTDKELEYLRGEYEENKIIAERLKMLGKV
ncbi:MAG: hypothetical protein NTX24_00955 [Candidatus Pacearchaeota archaeon]|nr:hypothetical protein [Candidatus Pacearchaeota archaeon]